MKDKEKQRENIIAIIDNVHDTWKHGKGDWKAMIADALIKSGMIRDIDEQECETFGDKEKQIEEMAKHGCYDGCASGLRKFCDEYDGKPCKNMVRIASGLYEQGYRKLPENAVVLTREEYEILLSNADDAFQNGLNESRELYKQEVKDETSKETAEKFVKLVYSTLTNIKVWNAMHNWWLEGKECPPLKKLLDELAKQFGVEIKEN